MTRGRGGSRYPPKMMTSFMNSPLHKCYYLAVPQKALGKHPKWTIVARWLWPLLLGERHSSLQGFLPQTAKTICHATSSLRRMLGSHKLGCFDTSKVIANHINKKYLKTTLYFLQSVKTDFLTIEAEIDHFSMTVLTQSQSQCGCWWQISGLSGTSFNTVN